MLKNINIDELLEGMYVDSIAKQKGNMKITTRGRVGSVQAIETLRKRGILEVIVDTSKDLSSDAKYAAESPSTEEVEAVKEKDEELNLVSFEDEIGKAAKLHEKGKSLQKRLLNFVDKGIPIDIAVPKQFTDNIVSSIDRNPNALLCMTKIREKDSYLLEHSLNVAILLANFASHLNLKQSQVQELSLSGFLHDIGKIKTPDEILHKPGRLTDEEMDIMKQHVTHGTDVLEQMGIPKRIVRTIGEHHERLDGNGYPDGKAGDEISLFGRMIAIVDTYDAITADRCYKAGMPSQKALQILLADSPEKYDQRLVQRFVKCVGIYPVGSLVKLNNERIAMIVRQHKTDKNKPIVKVFYSVRSNHYIEPSEIDLSKTTSCKIEKAVMASEFKLDFNKYFNEVIAV